MSAVCLFAGIEKEEEKGTKRNIPLRQPNCPKIVSLFFLFFFARPKGKEIDAKTRTFLSCFFFLIFPFKK